MLRTVIGLTRVASTTDVAPDTGPDLMTEFDSGLGEDRAYEWGKEGEYGEIGGGTDSTRKLTCGWERHSKRYRDAGQKGYQCSASYLSICQQSKSRMSNPSWISSDIVSMDYHRIYCQQICHTLTTEEDCTSVFADEYDAFDCVWLSFAPASFTNSNPGKCEPRTLHFHRPWAIQQYRLGRDKRMFDSFVMQYDYFVKHCHQLGFRSKIACAQRGKPCTWAPHLASTDHYGACKVDAMVILGSFAPELAEIYAPEAYCTMRKTESECLAVNEKNLYLEDFIILPDRIWPYYVAIFAVISTLFLMVKCCRMPPPPYLPRRSKNFDKRNID
jgi:hypothetical protein